MLKLVLDALVECVTKAGGRVEELTKRPAGPRRLRRVARHATRQSGRPGMLRGPSAEFGADGTGICCTDETASGMEQNREAKESRGDTIRTCDLYVPNVAL